MKQQPLILVVDDDEAPREMLKDFFESLGYDAKTFSDTPAATEYLKSGPEIDLVVLDVFIHGKSSLGFVDYLKTSVYADIPVIIISGAISPEYIQEALKKGVYDYIAKPFTLQEIRERVENALKFCLTTKQSKKYFVHIENLLKERTEMLEQLAFQSVKALVNAIEARDPYTRGHSDRVAAFAVRIAEALGLQEESLTKLNLAGLLHDVGKVGIPDLILLKPGKLSEFEYTIMKNHPSMSALIVSEVAPLNGIIPWIRCHHENFDGSGYPEKLAGGDIPLEAQILAIADNFDALSSLRPYRKKMAKDDVVAYIDSEFGKKFDPALRETSLAVLNEIEDKEDIRSSISPFIEKFREAMVYIDFLTGLYWYPYLRNYMRERMAKREPFFIVLLDIDGLSAINKLHGRMRGDEVIVKTGHTIQSVFLSPSVVVRAGADDFVVYDPTTTEEINRRIAAVRERLAAEGIGITSKILAYPRDGADFDTLISNI